MRLDIRIPIGLMFAVIGVMLALFGLFSNQAIYERSLGINVNIWWGVVLLAFGLIMFFFGRRGTSAVWPSDESPEGRKMEAREHRTGLEKEGKRGGGH
jgi:protein-S-isoprenylcysteine O-methyltransferase Ste14